MITNEMSNRILTSFRYKL